MSSASHHFGHNGLGKHCDCCEHPQEIDLHEEVSEVAVSDRGGSDRKESGDLNQ